MKLWLRFYWREWTLIPYAYGTGYGGWNAFFLFLALEYQPAPRPRA